MAIANNPLFPWAIAAAAQQAAMLPNPVSDLFLSPNNAAAVQARQMAATAVALQQFPQLFQPTAPMLQQQQQQTAAQQNAAAKSYTHQLQLLAQMQQQQQVREMETNQ